MRLGFLLLCVLVSLTGFSQEAVKENPEAYLPSRLLNHLQVLANDSLEGRNTAQEGQKKAALYIIDQLKAYGLEPGFVDSNGVTSWRQSYSFVKRFGDRREYYPEADNIIGLLKATSPSDEYVVISAHYDHLGIITDSIYNGADDNGSGSSSVLEIARRMATFSKERKRNVLFVFFSGEEKGLLGSKHLTNHPFLPLSSIYVDLNVDMIGRADSTHAADSNYVYVIGSDKISLRLDSILKECNQKHEQLDLDYTFNSEKDPQRLYYRSDHYNFAKHGIPVVFFFSGLHEDYHQPSDDIEKINLFYLHKRMMLVYHLAQTLVNYPEPLKD